MHLLVSNQSGNLKNIHYKNLIKITNCEKLAEAVKFDHVSILLDGYERKNENFCGSDCVMIDIDNQSVSFDNQYTIENFLYDFRRYKAFIVESKSHNLPKHGEVRERFHAYFPIKTIKDVDEYNRIKRLLANKCHGDGDAIDVSRFFFGNENPVIHETKGRQLISDAKFLAPENIHSRTSGRTIAIVGPPGVRKTQIIKKLKLLGENKVKVAGTTWLNARNCDSKTWQATFSLKYQGKGMRKTIDYIVIDEASILKQEDFEKIRSTYPLSCIVLVGDPNQMAFPNNALETTYFDLVVNIKNELNPRITDPRLKDFCDKLAEGKIDWNFINERQCTKEECKEQHLPITTFTNNDAKEWNKQFKLFQIGVTVKSKINTDKISNNELFTVDSIDDFIINLKRMSNNEIVKISSLFYVGEHWDYYNCETIRNFQVAEAITSFSIQGKTLNKNTIKLQSFICNATRKDGSQFPVLHYNSLIRGILVAASRVRNADDIKFIGDIHSINWFPPIHDWEEVKLKAEQEITLDASLIESQSSYDDICNTLFSSLKRNKVLQKTSQVTDSCLVHFVAENKAEKAYVNVALKYMQHSKGHRNDCLTNLSRKLRTKERNDPKFSKIAAFEYAQSIIGCEEAQSIKQRILNGNG